MRKILTIITLFMVLSTQIWSTAIALSDTVASPPDSTLNIDDALNNDMESNNEGKVIADQNEISESSQEESSDLNNVSDKKSDSEASDESESTSTRTTISPFTATSIKTESWENSSSIHLLTIELDKLRGNQSIFTLTELGKYFNNVSALITDSAGKDVSNIATVNSVSGMVFLDIITAPAGRYTIKLFGTVNSTSSVLFENVLFEQGYYDFGSYEVRLQETNQAGVSRLVPAENIKLRGGLLTINYLDSNREKLADSIISYGRIGEEWNSKPLEIEKYDLFEVEGDEAGTYNNSPSEVNYIYRKTDGDLTADVIPQETDLGGTLTEEQLDQSVINVAYNGRVLSKSEYDLELVKNINTDVANATVYASVSLIYKETGQKIALEIPVKVNWGNAIRFNGISNISAGVYNWHPKKNLITARLGDPQVIDNLVHPYFYRTYYSFTLHRLGEDESFINDDTIVYQYDVNGQKSRRAAVADFGDSQSEIAANIGDVVEVYHAESSGRLRQYISPSSEEQSVNSLNNKAYFELTSSGFNQLSFDRAVPVDTTLKAGTSKEELDKNIGNYLDISKTKNVTIIGFEKYPNTKSVGKDIGTIRIKEKLNSGKFIVYDYEIQFTIEAGNLEISQIKNGNFNFGEIKKSSRSQNVLANGSEAPSITINDYSSATQWGLYVSATPFMSEENKKLNGAFITLKNLKVKETVHTWLGIPSRDIELNEVPQMIGTMSNPNGIYGEENGQSVIQIGEVENGKLTGVDLTLLGNTIMDSSEYKAKITWELVGDPTMGGKK